MAALTPPKPSEVHVLSERGLVSVLTPRAFVWAKTTTGEEGGAVRGGAHIVPRTTGHTTGLSFLRRAEVRWGQPLHWDAGRRRAALLAASLR